MAHRLASTCVVLLGLVAAAPAVAEPRLEVSPKKLRPGDPVLVTVRGVDHAPKGTGARTPLMFFPVRQGWQAVFATPLDDATTELKVVITDPALSETLAVTARKWTEEQVKIDPEMAEPPADKRKLIDGDNAAIVDALKDKSPPRFLTSFILPSAGKGPKTSSFGAWRTLNGDYRSRHLGLDFGARKGSTVRSIQEGEVTLVRNGFLTGGTVVVSHGAGIASSYFHLDDIKVTVGDKIKRGATIGKVGLTGRTTGPHVHIGIWVPGGFIDPDAFFRLRLGPPIAPPAAPATKSATK